MVDEKPPPPGLPPIPTLHAIPTQLVEKWLEIPPENYITIKITRRDLDNLYFSLDKVISSTAALQQVVIHYSNARTEDANRELVNSQSFAVEALNHLRQFFTAIISSAKQP